MSLNALGELLATAILEKDTSETILWTWSYPTVSVHQREKITNICRLSECNGTQIPIDFVYVQSSKIWTYIQTTSVNSNALQKVTHCSLALMTRDFNPEKYRVLGRILLKLYLQTGSAAVMLENYLAVLTQGVCPSDESGYFNISGYSARNVFYQSSVGEIIRKFGVEVILIYVAVLLKKRIVIYHTSVAELQTITRSLLAFVFYRQDWSILFPHVQSVDDDVDELKSLRHYVAGFTEPSIQNRLDLFDLLVNYTTGEITVANQAKDNFIMGKFHKEIAQRLVDSAQDTVKSPESIVEDICNLTEQIREQLKSLVEYDSKDQSIVKSETMKSRKMAAATENFFLRFASAEGYLIE